MTESAAPVQQAAPEPREDDDERPALQLTRRNLVTLAGFLLASLAALYFLLPAVRGPRRHVEPDRRRPAVVDHRRAAVHDRHVRRLRRHVPRGLRARRARGSAGGRATRSRWRGSPRRGCSRPAARAASCSPRGRCAARGCEAHRRRQDDGLPRPDLPALHVRGHRLRLRAALGALQRPAPVHADVRPRRDRLHRAGDRARHRLHPDRPAAPDHAVRGAPRPLRAARAEARPGARGDLGRRARRARAPALARSRAARVDPLLGLPDRGAVGGVPRLRLRAAARRADPGLLRRHARQPAADAGRRRRRGGRDDRRLRRLRRQQRTRRRRRARLPCVHLLAAAAPGRDRLLPAPGHGRPLEDRDRRHRPPPERRGELHYTN